MPRKNSHISFTDQFCGAGGSSQGVRRLANRYGGGIEIKLALNHWKLAIETHNTNFPDTLHDCTDISACDPRRYPSTDILITSPECTNHSLAKGKKVVKKQLDLYSSGKQDPAAERSRATMWDVCRFAEYHSYNAIIVENVVDARKWAMFDAWLMAMHSLGYNHKCVYLNSMHAHPTPQSRDRMYVVFWKKGNKVPMLEYTPAAYCPKCGKNVSAIQTWKSPNKKWGKYRQQYVYCCPADGSVVEPYYYASFNCIDWTDIGQRIGDRSKPLSANTTKRIQYGLKKYGNQSMVLHAAYGNEARGVVRSVADPSFTQTTIATQALVHPFLVNDQQTSGVDCRVRSISGKMDTITTNPTLKIVTPFIIKLEHSHAGKQITEAVDTQTTRQSSMLVSPYARPTSEPLGTQTTCQGMALITQLQKNMNSVPATDPLNTVTAGGIKSGLVTTNAWNSFLAAYYGGSDCTKHFTEETGTVTTGERFSIINYQQPQIEDCYYRMLKPFEIKLAMAFDHDYVILGKGREQVKQCGNAVTPPAMEWLVQQVVESLK